MMTKLLSFGLPWTSTTIRKSMCSFAVTALCFAPHICLAQAAPPKPVALAPDEARARRVDDLVAKMTLEEKVSQMQNHAAAIPRLGVPEYDYWSEGLHGIARSGYATLFPQAIGLAATWDTTLLHHVADTISIEARAKYEQAVRDNVHDIFFGVTLWSPNINIFRDPRWGRGQETYGEDPYLTARLGVAFVSGLQGPSSEYLRVVSTPKHFAVHSGPESERHKFNVNVSPHDLQDTYLPAFRATVTEGHAQSVMCAYNSIDGAPACANQHLLADVLRKQWQFDGFVTSDCGAVTDVAEGHKYSADIERASVASLRAGTDTSCGNEYGSLTKAVKDGLVKESELDTAVRRLFMARFRLGLFDNPADVAYSKLPYSIVDSPEHNQLALKAARESMVLLKNDNGFLPLRPQGKTIAVIGPNAQSLAALEGNYNAIPSNPVTPLAGLQQALSGSAKVIYAQGSAYVDGLGVPVPPTAFHQPDGKLGLRAEYFNNNNFAGAAAVTRSDANIDFDWDSASPAEGISAKAFSVRWTGTLTMPAPGTYTLLPSVSHCYPCHDAESYTLYLDGKQIGSGGVQPATYRDAPIAPVKLRIADTKPHDFRLEYAHNAPLFAAGITLNWEPPAEALRTEAVEAAQQADVVIAFIGLSPDLEGEEMPVKVQGFAGGDRTSIDLPSAQQQLLEAVAKTGKPLVVVLMNGSALAVNWAQQNAKAILEAWYPGEAGGTAIAETLLGKNNPGGRLPVTFYASTDQLPAFDDYSMAKRTYRYSHAKPLYGFGAGMSYTQFAYTATKLSTTKLAAGDALTVRTTVKNIGSMAGDEVVEAYLVPPTSETAPVRALVGFQRVTLGPRQSRTVSLTIDPRQLSLVDATGKRSIRPGRYKLYVSGNQPTQADASSMDFEIVGSQGLPE
jgi:beta-glucosidase